MKMWPLPPSACGLVVPRKEIQELFEPRVSLLLFQVLSHSKYTSLYKSLDMSTFYSFFLRKSDQAER